MYKCCTNKARCLFIGPYYCTYSIGNMLVTYLLSFYNVIYRVLKMIFYRFLNYQWRHTMLLVLYYTNDQIVFLLTLYILLTYSKLWLVITQNMIKTRPLFRLLRRKQNTSFYGTVRLLSMAEFFTPTKMSLLNNWHSPSNSKPKLSCKMLGPRLTIDVVFNTHKAAIYVCLNNIIQTSSALRILLNAQK